MRRTLLTGFCLLMAAAAVWVGARGEPATQTAIGLGPLVSAERAFRAGEADAAQEAMRLAALRMERAGRPDLAARVRLRMVSMGAALWEKDREAGWPFLAMACLLAPDFGVAADVVEAWALAHGGGPTFTYPLVRRSGRTLWGTTPQWAPAWLYRELPSQTRMAGLPSGLYNQVAGELPPAGRWYQVALVKPVLSPGPVPVRLQVAAAHEPHQSWFYSLGNQVRWEKPLSQNGDQVFRGEVGHPATTLLDRLVGFSETDRVSFQASLVREYTPLDSLVGVE